MRARDDGPRDDDGGGGGGAATGLVGARMLGTGDTDSIVGFRTPRGGGSDPGYGVVEKRTADAVGVVD